ncbi:SGNH/GDSL hydrolase family protein [Neobacillus sp. LXY-4]|uniref:SGNH/GDSL hydrolase family protein n=1 Tax=Neobacillus sp. LXY-4 TaxID=3379826 RepID=UPI003EE40BC3
MKTYLTIFYAIVCIIFIGASHYYWSEKTTVLQAAEQNNDDLTKADSQKEVIDELLPLAGNWPENSVERFKQTLTQNQPFKIVIAGSSALGGETGWAAQTKSRLLEAFGADHLTVEIKEYDLTSAEFIEEEKHVELASLKADMVLLEPFILKSNGEVGIEDTLSNLSVTIDTIREASPKAEIILQPSYPIFQASIYPAQVNKLKNYATEKQLTYLDHWSLWPDPNTEDIKSYLLPDQSAPNEEGHKVWCEYVSAYLIKK